MVTDGGILAGVSRVRKGWEGCRALNLVVGIDSLGVRPFFFLDCFVGCCSARVEGVPGFMWFWHCGAVEFSWGYGPDMDGLFLTENGWRSRAEESSSA